MKINAKNCLMAAALITVANSMAWAELPSDYYSTLDGKCGAELKTAIHQLCRDHYVLPKSSTTSTYTDLKNLFTQTDFQMIDGVEYWWDMYSTELKPLTTSFGDCGYQREHAFPKSWWKDETQSKDVEYTTAYCDMHHLYPANGPANASKANWPLGIVGNNPTTNNGAVKIGAPIEGLVYGIDNLPSSFKVFEPGDEYKGDFARAYMYMASTYQDLTWNEECLWMVERNAYPTFTQWALDLILDWSRNDQVSKKEIDRNTAVENIQKNRNPFIDMPNLHEYVWGDSINTPLNIRTIVKTFAMPAEPGEPAVFYDRAMTGDDNGDCYIESAEGFEWVWKHDSQYGWKGSAYKGSAVAAEAKLFTPEIDLTDAVIANLKFDHAVNKGTPSLLKVYIYSGDEQTDISDRITWPAGTSWSFFESGDISLADFLGKKIHVVFQYNSTDGDAPTWEIKNVKIDGEQKTSSLQLTVNENAPVEYYSIDGLRVNPDQHRGIVIRRQGNTITRTILR